MAEITAEIFKSVAALPAAEWDALNLSKHPFTAHSFLSLLEESGSVGPGSGWSPSPIIIRDDAGKLAAALPAYLKSHSQGEYVFDHHWADAYERAGGRYYPKLQIAAPFSPVPGPRLLMDDEARALQLLSAAQNVAEQNGISSVHATFVEEAQLRHFRDAGWLIRKGNQFHWANDGYDDFDDFLGALSSRKRKAIRKERRGAQADVDIKILRGEEIEPHHVAAMWEFYQDTGIRKWGQPYLTHEFFAGMVAALGDALVLFLAEQDGVPAAGALNFVGRDCIYGRYWGCNRHVPYLHFELCYYQAIDFAIAHKIPRVEAGAQGEHKLARGYVPTATYSAHYIVDPGFRDAIADFLKRETAAIERDMEFLGEMGPFKRV